jgi:hypothetical protein
MPIKIFIGLFCGVLLLSSCKKWLDVKPESQVSKNELFQTASGYEEALNGVYSRCSQSDIYGKEVSFGLLDVLAQNYYVPGLDPLKYLQTSLYRYTDQDFITRKDSIWNGLYSAIANCNLILANIEDGKKVMPSTDYTIIKGEALGMRAYLHFDALRIFAPSFASNPNAPAIPYVSDFSNKVTPLSTVSAALTKIIQDLNDAKTMLATVDPIVSGGYIVGYPTLPSDGSTEQNETSLFMQNRRNRLNYYAVCGELARAYLYNNDKANALKNAMEVINSRKFPWTSQADFIDIDPRRIDRILYKELVFSWYIPPQTKPLLLLFGSDLNSLYMLKNDGASIYETGGVGGDDLRYKQWFKTVTDISSSRLDLMKYTRDADSNRHPLVAPALRLSELYYIAAECTYDTDPAKATGYVDSVRLHRGIGTPMTASSKDDFLGQLVKEARKEFYGEGQIFYMYKRLNRNILGLSGSIIPVSNNRFVLPLPNDEIEFGNR